MIRSVPFRPAEAKSIVKRIDTIIDPLFLLLDVQFGLKKGSLPAEALVGTEGGGPQFEPMGWRQTSMVK